MDYRIVFTLDDVIRAKTKQIYKTYQRETNEDFDIDGVDLTNNDIASQLGMTKKQYETWLYDTYGFEVFGEADVTEPFADKKLNKWLLDIEDDEELMDDNIEVSFSNPYEFNQTIGYTYFFLAKKATRVRKVFLPLNSSDIWKEADILVTADPKLVKEKPEGKICVKIETPYNKNCEADVTYKNVVELFEDKEFFNKVNIKK